MWCTRCGVTSSQLVRAPAIRATTIIEPGRQWSLPIRDTPPDTSNSRVNVGWALGLASPVTAIISLARLVSSRGHGRLGAGIELFMATGMTAMALPMTTITFERHGLWWVTAFASIAVAGIGMALRDARRHSWRHGRHWAHHVIGSVVMMLMVLTALPAASAGPAIALGMPTMAGTKGMIGMGQMGGMVGMGGMKPKNASEIWTLVGLETGGDLRQHPHLAHRTGPPSAA